MIYTVITEKGRGYSYEHITYHQLLEKIYLSNSIDDKPLMLLCNGEVVINNALYYLAQEYCERKEQLMSDVERKLLREFPASWV